MRKIILMVFLLWSINSYSIDLTPVHTLIYDCFYFQTNIDDIIQVIEVDGKEIIYSFADDPNSLFKMRFTINDIKKATLENNYVIFTFKNTFPP